MGLIQATIETLASVLGCRQDQAEDVVHSPASARAAMSRRGFFKAAGAVAAGVVMLDAATAEAAAPEYFRGIDHPSRYTSSYRSFAEALKEAYSPDKIRALMSVSANDYLFLSGDLWRFKDDTRELMATVTDIDKARGIITVDSAPVRRK